MRLNTPPATMVALRDESLSTGFLGALPRDAALQLEPRQLDALEWAKNFMERYERTHPRKDRSDTEIL